MTKNLIIWDWNGTLLNDIDACLESINQMLEKRDMNKLEIIHYKEVFTFPVQNYYKSIGFDFKAEPFEKLSVEYIDLYKEKSKYSGLQEGAIEALQFFKKLNYKQIILSASEQSALENQIKQRKIFDYFDSIIGLNNIHAKSKTDNALKYLKENNSFDKVILIGDTYHDYEVASALKSECLLVMNGHQNLKKFHLNDNVRLIRNLNYIKEEIKPVYNLL